MEEFEMVDSSIYQELLSAVCTNNLYEIESLIRTHPCALDYVYSEYNRPIFLVACSEEGVKAETVRKLLKLGANCRDCRSDDAWGAIHFAAVNTNYEMLKVLLEYNPACVEDLDKHGYNALHFLIRDGDATSRNFLKCANLLIKNGVCVHQLNSKNRTPLDMTSDEGVLSAIKKMIEGEGVNCRRCYGANENINQLKQFMFEKDQEKCIQEIDKMIKEDPSLIDKCCPIDSTTLLQLCCKIGLCDVVKHLLSKKISPSATTDKDPDEPIMIAVSYGFPDILEALLEKHDDASKLDIQILTRILIFIDGENDKFKECYRVFIRKIEEIPEELLVRKINERDGFDNTPLHYAIWFADSEIIEELLRLGAYPGAANEYGQPLNYIKSETWERHLNTCIISDSIADVYKPNFRVIFEFKSLIPPCQENTSKSNNEDTETANNVNLDSKRLTPETKFSLKFSIYYYVVGIVFSMTKLPHLRVLLKHPVIVSFLTLKWQQYQWLFWINFLFYIIFASTFLAYMFSDYRNVPSSVISYYFLVVNVVVLIIRELFQAFIYGKKYLGDIANYIEVALIGATAFILSGFASRHQKRQLWSMSIIFLSFELIAIIGKHPYFSTKIVMLKTVSYNFVVAFFSYSFLIIAFAFSFHLLFRTEPNELTDDSRENENVAEPFNNPGESIFKTIVMLTGEFDSSSMDFDTFAVISKLIFAFFIFMIHLILLNLLNGLAVSDTKEIKDQAEILGHIARATHINNVEKILSKNTALLQLINGIRKLFGYKIYDRTLVKCEFFPHKNKLIYSSDELRHEHNFLRNLFCLGLDDETRKMVLSIIQNRCR